MKSDPDPLAEKRAIRLRIGRGRRRIDRRLRALQREGREMMSWRTWVQRVPAQSLLAAVGAGLAVAAGLRKRKLRALGLHLARLAGDRTLMAVIRDLRDLWARPARRPKDANSPPSSGDDHD